MYRVKRFYAKRKKHKIKIRRIDGDIIAACDFCLKRQAAYEIERDGTRLCEHCLDLYLKEYDLRGYELEVKNE